jgi:DNA polymerase III delta prime subunit
MIKDILFWEKFRPTNLRQIVLLPRIEKFIKDGIKTNVIFYGHMGTGKSSLVRILLKNKSFKYLNASLNNGVDVLRDELYDFCTSRQSLFSGDNDDKLKYVYLDEFDNSTTAFQEAFKAFIEEYDKGVRFVVTMNHIENVIPEIRSRFNLINFDPINEDEVNFLKSGYSNYLKQIVKYLNKVDGFELNDDIIKNVINKNFPDLRSSVQDIQQIYITNDKKIFLNSDENYLYIHQYMTNGKNDVIENFDFVENNFSDKPLDLLKSLGRPFIKYLMKTKPYILNNKGFLIIKTTKEHNEMYNKNIIDPIVHLTNYVNELKKIIN